MAIMVPAVANEVLRFAEEVAQLDLGADESHIHLTDPARMAPVRVSAFPNLYLAAIYQARATGMLTAQYRISAVETPHKANIWRLSGVPFSSAATTDLQTLAAAGITMTQQQYDDAISSLGRLPVAQAIAPQCPP